MKFKNLACEMVRQGISRQQLAEKLKAKGLNVNYSMVCRWLNGKGEPSFTQAGMIAEILDQSLDYLFKIEKIN